MPVLALDTSADVAVALLADAPDGPEGPAGPDGAAASLAVPVAGRLLAERRVTEQRRHAELLAPMIVEVLTEAGLDRRELSAVVVGTGPAPFTGLRAGLVTARTLAFALGIPVHGVCSLDALAAAAFDAGLAPDRDVLVVTDARRREVYAARYRRRAVGRRGPGDAADGDRRSDVDEDREQDVDEDVEQDVELVSGPGVWFPAALALDGDLPGVVVVGPGAALYPEHLTAAAGAPVTVAPATLARLARVRLARGAELPTEPLYLRRPDVTPAAGRKRATG
ncbi:tRNA (adenosine(37)-N6)-threonylcarbamoyltransferase complex dimerization subunit type 1 TsaB [Cellulomonas sp. KRMCY2]|uniref:tRNA (adenosine(37)-N6)-threonylcarbamoyltransferase complex dimerization subunit type 1 TsaB n=1 Tax=Cellulomonas sp. KRMCY2 TaxID=1304865 RepID=UPI00045E6A37|nr:tRNA (adenosine(37)-N6)-threonylcarbamoyltransferase complex dimerization subunit type 1 TsaB [Cellulomonas sp. KRMCY2]